MKTRAQINAAISRGVRRYHADIAAARAEVLEAYDELEALTRLRAERGGEKADLSLERYVLRKLHMALDRLRAERGVGRGTDRVKASQRDAGPGAWWLANAAEARGVPVEELAWLVLRSVKM